MRVSFVATTVCIDAHFCGLYSRLQSLWIYITKMWTTGDLGSFWSMALILMVLESCTIYPILMDQSREKLLA